MIFEDDIEVSPLYYKWLSTAHDHYGYGYHANVGVDEYGYDSEGRLYTQRPKIPDLASFGLSRQTLVPLKSQYKKSKLNARIVCLVGIPWVLSTEFLGKKLTVEPNSAFWKLSKA